MQLDIFADSRDVMPRNDVLDALQRRHASAARQAWQRLANEYPEDDTLITLAMLVAEIKRDATAYFADHRTLDAARRALIDEVSPAALRLLGESPARVASALLARTGAAGNAVGFSRRRQRQPRGAAMAARWRLGGGNRGHQAD